MDDQGSNQPEQPLPASQPAPQIDQFELENYLRKLKAEQNLGYGIVGGMFGMIVGAVLWAIVTVVTDYQIGWMAIGVGFLTGGGVRFFGRGFETSFGVAGAVLSFLGCALGNFFSTIYVTAQVFGVSLALVLVNLSIPMIAELMTATFSSMDLLFYGIAIYFGYRYSFRRISQDELSKLAR